jgi:hypothetical protein
MLSDRRAQVVVAIVVAVILVVGAFVLFGNRSTDTAAAPVAGPSTTIPSGGTTPGSTAPADSASPAGDATTTTSSAPGAGTDPTGTGVTPAAGAPTTTAVKVPSPKPAIGIPADDLHPPAAITISQTNGLHDGQPVTVHVAANPGSAIFSVEAKMCRPDQTVTVTAEFLYSQGWCAKDPVSPGADNDVQSVTPPPNTSADLTFKVGVGTTTWTADSGPVSLTCAAGHPCRLVLELEVPNKTLFYTVPLTFA